MISCAGAAILALALMNILGWKMCSFYPCYPFQPNYWNEPCERGYKSEAPTCSDLIEETTAPSVAPTPAPSEEVTLPPTTSEEVTTAPTPAPSEGVTLPPTTSEEVTVPPTPSPTEATPPPSEEMTLAPTEAPICKEPALKPRKHCKCRRRDKPCCRRCCKPKSKCGCKRDYYN